MIEKFKQKVFNGYPLSFGEAVKLCQTKNKEALYEAANDIRKHFCGDVMELCSITNAKSGKCSEDCKWCSQSSFYDTHVEVYELVESDKALSEAALNAAKGVCRHSLVTSGRKVSDRVLDGIIPIYQRIRAANNMELCASMGLITESQMVRLRDEAGISHYHCNLETAPSFFSHLVTTHTPEEKIATIKIAQKLGIKVCSGGIIGMGETMEQRVELAVALRDLGVQSIPVNFLMPVVGTPLQNAEALSEEEILTTIAIFRFLNPTAWIRFAGGRLSIKHFQQKALFAGVNSALTGDYLTTTGSNVDEDIRDFTKAGFRIK